MRLGDMSNLFNRNYRSRLTSRLLSRLGLMKMNAPVLQIEISSSYSLLSDAEAELLSLIVTNTGKWWLRHSKELKMDTASDSTTGTLTIRFSRRTESTSE